MQSQLTILNSIRTDDPTTEACTPFTHALALHFSKLAIKLLTAEKGYFKS